MPASTPAMPASTPAMPASTPARPAVPVNRADVERLEAALPPDGANPVGRVARDLLVGHLKRLTPGNYSQLIGTGPSFRELFFPGLATDPRQGQIGPLTGLGDDFFAGYAVAALCQQMSWCTSRLRPQLLGDAIATDLAGRAGQLRRRVWNWYAYLADTVDGPIRAALAAFGGPDQRREAAGIYLAGITSPTWAGNKLVQQATDGWPDRDWELFHHWIKLTALGAAPGDIDAAIATIVDLKVPVPSYLGPGVWRDWSGWFGADLGGGDVADAVGPILATRCVSYGGQLSCMAEDAAFEFTAHSQPGSPFRRPPSGSCLAPGTKVRMADGTLRDIAAIAPGDEVATPYGARQVAVRSAPPLAGRHLVRFAGTGIAFAPTHPFVVHGAGPRYAAADPGRLADEVPLLARLGVRALDGPDPVVLSRWTATGPVPYPVPELRPAPDLTPQRLYDIFLDVGADGRSEFYAGDDRVQLLVSSEVPRYDLSPLAALVILRLLTRCAPTILDVLAPVPDDAFADLLAVGLDAVDRGMLPAIGPRLWSPDRDRPAAGVLDPAGVDPALAELISRLSVGGDVDHRLGVLIEQVANRFAAQFDAAIQAGWRMFGGADSDAATVLALTVYGMEFTGRSGTVDPRHAQVDAVLRCGDSETRNVLVTGADAERWWYPCDATAYYSRWRPELQRQAQARTDPDWTLSLSVVPRSDGRSVGPDPGAARMVLPRQIPQGYQHFTVPVVDPDRRSVGRALLDLRPMGADALTMEVNRRDAWTPDERPAVAWRLSRLATSYLNQHFPIAVRAFQTRTVTAGAHAARLGVPTRTTGEG